MVPDAPTSIALRRWERCRRVFAGKDAIVRTTVRTMVAASDSDAR